MESVPSDFDKDGYNGKHKIDEVDAKLVQASQSVSNIVRMPTERHSMYYNMSHKKRGMAIIFNHENFGINIKRREGTNVDCDCLKESLEVLGFQVTVHQDLVCEKVMQFIALAAKADHTDHDCIMICVLSHGGLEKLYAKDFSYSPEVLWDSFTADKCPTLAGKPKIFFLQACRGEKLDSGVAFSQIDGPSSSDRVPIHADFLVGYSTVPGYFSWRNIANGSWYIQALAKDLRQYGTERDLLTLLTFVSQKVAYDYESYNPDNLSKHKQKQIPSTTTTLTRLLVFGKKD